MCAICGVKNRGWVEWLSDVKQHRIESRGTDILQCRVDCGGGRERCRTFNKPSCRIIYVTGRWFVPVAHRERNCLRRPATITSDGCVIGINLIIIPFC